jgi:hypothetical protein
VSIKGQAFRALAALAGNVDRADGELGAAIVDCLETSHILPVPQPLGPLDAWRGPAGLAASGYGGRTGTPSRLGPGVAEALPPPTSGLAYELDHVENESQSYGTTTAFIVLLRALFACGPQFKTGKGWLKLHVEPHFTYVRGVLLRATCGCATLMCALAHFLPVALEMCPGLLWTTCSFGRMLDRTMSPASGGACSLRACRCSTTSLRRTRSSFRRLSHRPRRGFRTRALMLVVLMSHPFMFTLCRITRSHRCCDRLCCTCDLC